MKQEPVDKKQCFWSEKEEKHGTNWDTWNKMKRYKISKLLNVSNLSKIVTIDWSKWFIKQPVFRQQKCKV